MSNAANRSPRDLGKQAYRKGVRLVENPFLFPASEAGTAWAEGWLHERTYHPLPQDGAASATDPDCMSPWTGDDSGYGGYG